MTDLAEITALLESIGPLGMLVFFGLGFMRRWWVLGWTYNEMVSKLTDDLGRVRDDSTRWRTLLLSQVSLTEEAVNHLTKQKGPE